MSDFSFRIERWGDERGGLRVVLFRGFLGVQSCPHRHRRRLAAHRCGEKYVRFAERAELIGRAMGL